MKNKTGSAFIKALPVVLNFSKKKPPRCARGLLFFLLASYFLPAHSL